MSRTPFVLAALLAVGCAPPAVPVQTASLTSAELREVDSAQKALHESAYADAMPYVELALALAPNDPWAVYQRGVVLAGVGRTDDAVAAFERAESLYGDDRPHGRELAIYGRARALDGAGRCNEARAAYSDYAKLARARDAESADLALAYGRLCFRRTPSVPDQTAADQALMAADYAKALELVSGAAPQTARDRAWFDLARGTALAGLGRTEEAIDAFDGAAVSGELRARALFGKARALAASSRCAEARTAYTEYAALVPEDAEMAQRYARMCRP